LTYQLKTQITIGMKTQDLMNKRKPMDKKTRFPFKRHICCCWCFFFIFSSHNYPTCFFLLSFAIKLASLPLSFLFIYLFEDPSSSSSSSSFSFLFLFSFSYKSVILCRPSTSHIDFLVNNWRGLLEGKKYPICRIFFFYIRSGVFTSIIFCIFR
jgi:hypothetical protein